LIIENLEGSNSINWRQIIDVAIGMLHDFPFRIPPDVMLIIRVGSIGEGVLRQLDPEFDILAAAQTFLREQGFFERAAQMKLGEMRTEFEASLWALLRLPATLERDLEVRDQKRAKQARISTRNQQRLSRSLGYAILAAGSLIGSVQLISMSITYALVGLGVTLVFVILFLRSSVGDC
jgi:predicted unusual protein kinase regulating ubiquinone biosynthesis (AarF/ABC1/UbiB family)